MNYLITPLFIFFVGRQGLGKVHQLKLKTLARGQASRGGRQEASSEAASSGRLARRRRDQCKGTSQGSSDASHDDQGQAGAGLHRVLVSPLVQRGKAHAKASGKGCHSRATRPRLAERQDGGHRGAQDDVITRAFGRQRPSFGRIACTSCPLQIGRCWIPSRSILGRGPGPL